MFDKMVRRINRAGKTHRHLSPLALLPCPGHPTVRRHCHRPAARAVAVALSVCMVFTATPQVAFAVEGGTNTGLCEHHPAHTVECGYQEVKPGHPCEHKHTADCYTGGYICGDIEDEDATASDSDAQHVHTQDCRELDCPHERGEHTDDCRYTEEEEGTPCGNVCAECGKLENVQSNGIEEMTVTVFDELDVAVQNQSVKVGTALEDLVLPDTLSATVQTGDEDPKRVVIGGVFWEPDVFYEGAAGSYVFTASAAGYICAQDVGWPVITVTVEEPDEIDALCAAIDALPTVDELYDNAPGDTDTEFDAWVTEIRGKLAKVPDLWEQLLALAEDTGAMERITEARAEKLAGLNSLAERLGEVETLSGNAPTADITYKYIFANGAPLLLEAGRDDPTKTVVYVDVNNNGQPDPDIDTIFDPDGNNNGMNNTVEGNDLSEWEIYGASNNTVLTGSTKLTMTGGKVNKIFGGGLNSNSSVTGDTSVTISGGTVEFYVSGGGYLCAVSGTASVSVTGGTVEWCVYGGDYNRGSVGDDVTISITGGTVAKAVYGMGYDSTVGGQISATIGDRAKVGVGTDGVYINGGDVVNGVDSFTIAPSLTGNADSIRVVLPRNFNVSTNPTIATGAVEGDLAKIKLVGDGAAGNDAYFEGGAIKVRKTHTHAMSVDCSTTVGNQKAFNKALTSQNGKLYSNGVKVNESLNTYHNLPAGSYYLEADVELDGVIFIEGYDGATANLCLNGHKLAYTGSAKRSVMQLNQKTLNLCDCDGSNGSHDIISPVTNQSVTISGGLITGATNSCINCDDSSTLSLYGGAIAGNGGETVYGGGIKCPGTFVMHGGSIIHNMGGYGGGVHMTGSLIMTGGEISNNRATSKYGGVCAGLHNDIPSTVTLSGDPVISGNVAGTGQAEADRNLCLSDGVRITVGANFIPTTPIGITTDETPMRNSPVSITGQNSQDYTNCFKSEDNRYVIQNGSNNEVQLALLKSTDATLSNLTYKVGNGQPTAVPDFTAGTFSYNVNLPYNTAQNVSITLTGTTNNSQATITENNGVTLSGGSGTAIIKVKAEDGTTTKTYTVNFTTAADTRSNAKEITAFTIQNQVGDTDIKQDNHTITVTMPYGTDVTSLTPAITVSGGATVSPQSGTAQNFTDPVTYTVTAENETTQEYNVTVQVQSAITPSITTSSLPDGAVGTQYSETLTATGTAPITWSKVSGDLPGGLTLNSNGAISGTPTGAGRFTFTVKAENSAGSATHQFMIIVPTPLPTVTGVTVTPTAADVQKGGVRQFSASVTGTNSPAQTVTWSLVGSYASGTSISDTGLLTVASDEAQAAVTVKATSTADTSKSGTVVVTVTNPDPDPLPAYGVSLSQTGAYTFAAATVGYGEQAAHSVTVNNSGNQPTGALTIGLSGSNADSFTLSRTDMDSIATNGEDTFTVKPVTGLGAGAYTAIVTVTGGNGISGSFSVRFKVAPSQPLTYTITASTGGGGTISPDGAVTVNEGESQTFTITPARNYAISRVTVDGSDKGTAPAYTFENVTGDHSISVTFRYIGGYSSDDDDSSSNEDTSSALYTTTSTMVRENGTSTTKTQTISKDNSGKTTTVTTEVTKDAAGNATGSATTVTTDHITASADQGGSTVTVKPDAGAINSAAAAAGATMTNPMDISVAVPQDTVKNELQKTDVNTVSVEVVIPKSVGDNPSVQTAGVTVEKETVDAARQTGKKVTVTVREDTGTVKAVWALDGQAMGNAAGQSTDLNLGVRTAPVQSVDPIAVPVKPTVTAAGQENGLVISLTADGTLLSSAKLTVPATNQTAITAGSTVALYQFDPNTGALIAIPGGVYSVDTNGNVTIDVPAGPRARAKETYVLLPVPAAQPAAQPAERPAADVGGGAVHTIKAGDTLNQISRQYGCRVEDLLALNPGVDIYDLRIGSDLRIP